MTYLKKYVEEGAGYCPICGEEIEDTPLVDISTDPDTVLLRIQCRYCNKRWTDIYDYVGTSVEDKIIYKEKTENNKHELPNDDIPI